MNDRQQYRSAGMCANGVGSRIPDCLGQGHCLPPNHLVVVFSLLLHHIYIYIYIHAPLLACCTVCLDRTSASSVEIPIRNGTGGGNFSTASLHRLSRYVVLASSGLLYRTFALRKLLDRWDRLEDCWKSR